MFKQNTDLDAMKRVGCSFLYMDVKPMFGLILVQHPIFESCIQPVPSSDNHPCFVNIMEEDGLKQARRWMKSRIMKSKNPLQLYMIIRKAYRLTYLKFCKKYMSRTDFSQLFADAWVGSENPNMDVNVPLSMAVKWFRSADKKHLMTEIELDTYKSLGSEFTIYRGVGVGRTPNGLSWTSNLRIAEWFAHRFDTKQECGYVQTAKVKKKDVLAYFNSRGEDELVVDTSKLKVSVI